MGLNKAQKEAVEYLEGPLLVLAGPGTGKTQLLSEKVVYILKNTDTNPENILCLTFTEAGARNMRERLQSLIGVDALKVNINTYHAFGTEILALYRDYAEDFDRRLDNAIDEVTQHKIVRGLVEALPGNDILRGDAIANIISVIGSAKAAQLTAGDLALIAEQNIEDAKVLGRTISPFLKKVVPRKYEESVEAAYGPIAEILRGHEQDAPIVGRVERSIAALSRELSVALEQAAASVKPSVKPLSKWRDANFEKDGRGNYRLRDRVRNLKLASVARVMKKYEKYLREHGLYDFNDMIEEAVRALKTDAGFRATLQEKFQYVMLDEFQDTNPSQFEIVKQLTDYEQPQVMAVGDDDQAIYEFQGAEVTNLKEFVRHYKAKVIALTENYRSTQEILDLGREIINQAPDRFEDKKLVAHKMAGLAAGAKVMGADDGGGRSGKAQDSEQSETGGGAGGRSGAGGGAEQGGQISQIWRYEFTGADAEYAWVAGKVAELVKAGVPQSEIAVISCKNKYFEPLLPYLKAYPELKLAYDKRDNLLEDEKVHELVTVLTLALQMAREQKTTVQMLEILTYPWLGLPILEVVRLNNQARSEHKAVYQKLAEAEPEEFGAAEKMRGVAEWLAELMSKSFTEPVESLVSIVAEKILAGSDVSEYEKFHFYENLASLMGKLKKYVGEERQLKVRDLVAMVDDYREAEMQLTAFSPYRDADEAVQILSAHKSKGLEFEYVFIISADHAAWGKQKGNNDTLSLPKNLQQIRHTGKTDSEKLRVLYVALTRAKSGLIITNSLHDFNEKSPQRLEYLNESEQKTETEEYVASPYIPRGRVCLKYEMGAPEVKLNDLRNWLIGFWEQNPEMRALYAERMKNWRMSASALTKFIDVVYAGPEEFFKDYVLRAPREPDTEQIILGDLLHRAFEAITKDGLEETAALALMAEEIKKWELPDVSERAIYEKAAVGLSAAVKNFAEILGSGLAEVEFPGERLVVDGIPVAGKIDHIAIDENAKTIEVYDFKTGHYHDKKWESHLTLYKYMLQLGFYKLLLGASRKYRDYRVERAHILFVMPDADGEVHDKVYEYNEADERTLRDLMKAVYGQASSLAFLDDPEVMVEANPRRTLKDVKGFVEMLVGKLRTT